MFLRVANDCDNRLTVQPSVEDFDFFTLGARFDVVCIDRALFVHKTPTGQIECRENVQYACEGYGRALRRTMRTPLPTFTVNAAEFVLDGEFLRWAIPPDWELPWSKNAPVKRLEQIVRREFTRRCRSAHECKVDVKLVTQKVPQWARGVLPAREWIEIAEGHFV